MADKKELISVLWDGANVLRSKMDANEYKDYLLGIVFYKYLSDTFLIRAYDLINDTKPDTIEEALEAYTEVYNSEDGEALVAELKDSYRYAISPELTYTALAQKVNNNEFQREDLQKGFNQIEQSATIFEGLFADVDLYSTRLGTGEQKQSATVAELIKTIDAADLLNHSGDVLGDAYEYLIGEFASETGKKAGEFYTPQAVSKILTRIAIDGQTDKRGLSVYDPAMGSGSLMLNARKYSTQPEWIRYYGQELITSTFNLARMNMFLHNVSPDNQRLRNGDTLDADWPTDEPTSFDMVLMNPPYSQNWKPVQGFLKDPRFSDYGVLAPKSKADYAFLLHGYYHLKASGTMAIILPHGVLFRGAAEGKIRQKLIDNGAIYAVIGLPSNLFYNTSIPTCVIVLKKDRVGRDILFIDASKFYTKGKKQNVMTEDDIDTILELYKNRTDVEKQAHLASYEEIEANDFNLNIPRYVDTFEKEPDIDMTELMDRMEQTDRELRDVQSELLTGLSKLASSDEKKQQELERFRKMLGGM